jgi:hypothetical protein
MIKDLIEIGYSNDSISINLLLFPYSSRMRHRLNSKNNDNDSPIDCR